MNKQKLIINQFKLTNLIVIENLHWYLYIKELLGPNVVGGMQ